MRGLSKIDLAFDGSEVCWQARLSSFERIGPISLVCRNGVAPFRGRGAWFFDKSREGPRTADRGARLSRVESGLEQGRL